MNQTSQQPVMFKVGDGATVCGYSDRRAMTVIEVRKGGKEVVVQRDKATLTNNDERQFYPGGFVGHTVFPNGQKYSYECDPQGYTEVYSLRKNGRWVLAGDSMNGGQRLIDGRHEHYDYNF